MQIGIALPHFGPSASTEAIIRVAREAEALGFDSVWVLDRLLWPLQATAKYPGNPRGELPVVMRDTYDPIAVLAFVAAHTRRVRLGTSVLVASYRSPVVVAKMGATLDLLSSGRLILGLGGGWSRDEFVAVNESLEQRDERTDEFIKVLCLLWTTEPVRYEGKYYRIPESHFLPKPVQRPRPQIWIGGNTKRAIQRAAELGDGWHPTSRLDPPLLAQEMGRLRVLAEKAGRAPDSVALTLRWNAFPSLSQKSGLDETRDRLRRYEEAGVQHICIDFNLPQASSLTAMLENMQLMREKILPAI